MHAEVAGGREEVHRLGAEEDDIATLAILAVELELGAGVGDLTLDAPVPLHHVGEPAAERDAGLLLELEAGLVHHAADRQVGADEGGDRDALGRGRLHTGHRREHEHHADCLADPGHHGGLPP